MEIFKVTLNGTAIVWDAEKSEHKRIDAPMEFIMVDSAEVGAFVATLADTANERLRIEIKREDV